MTALAGRLLACGFLLLPLTRATAVELEVGARFPAGLNEKIVVKNDGGVSNDTLHSHSVRSVIPATI